MCWVICPRRTDDARSSSLTINWRSTPGGDEDLLRVELAMLHGEDYNLDLLGFEDVELARLLEAQDAVPGLADEDAVPEVQEVVISRPGDLWLSGDPDLPHCGGEN